MATRTEIKVVDVPGIGHIVCTIEHTILASGAIGVSLLKDARHVGGGPVLQDSIREQLGRMLGVVA